MLRHVKRFVDVSQILNTQNSHSFVHSSYLLPDDSAGRTARVVVAGGQNRSFPQPASSSSSPWLSKLISPGRCTADLFVAAVLRRKFHPINVINQSTISDGTLSNN
jgi:hypothetical protein